MTSPLASQLDQVPRRTRAVAVWAVALHLSALAALAAAGFQMRAVKGRPLPLADQRAVYVADIACFVSGHLVLFLSLAGLVFLSRWTRAAYASAAALGAQGLTMSASRAAWSYALPVVQPFLSWRALSALDRALLATHASRSTPRAASDASGHYRDNAAEPRLDAQRIPSPPIAKAWALWALGQAGSVAVSVTRHEAVTTRALVRSLWFDAASLLAIAVSTLLLYEVISTISARIQDIHDLRREEASP
ncbi:MAG: DUF4328 domain-containing protein [Polyangiales bacterium]